MPIESANRSEVRKMDFKTWSELLNENLRLLNREFTNADLQRLFKDIDEIKEKQNLNDNTMAILLEGFIVLKLKLPLSEEKRQQKLKQDQDTLKRFNNYLKGEIDRT